MEIKPILRKFDLKNKEIDVYLACLELGMASAIQIGKKASVIRTTVYDILQNLIAKGLIGQTKKGKRRLFYAENPEKLKKLLLEKEKQLAEIMPILMSMQNIAGAKPTIRYYEGKEGLKEVYRDTLNYKGELCAYVSENIIILLGRDFADEYKEKRKKAKIFAKVIAPDTKELIEYKQTDKKDTKITKLVSKTKFPFTIEMNIYGNKIALMSFKEEMGIIIESTEIAKNMKFLFELAWQGARA
jgi:sugar-specific transcriptional regulator TrmB